MQYSPVFCVKISVNVNVKITDESQIDEVYLDYSIKNNTHYKLIVFVFNPHP